MLGCDGVLLRRLSVADDDDDDEIASAAGLTQVMCYW